MKLKSTSQKPKLNFINSNTIVWLLCSLVGGVIVSNLIIALNWAIMLKIVMIGAFFWLIGKNKERVPRSEKSSVTIVGILSLVIALSVCEYGLYKHSTHTSTHEVTMTVEDHRCNDEKAVISFHDVDSNNRIVQYTIDKSSDKIEPYKKTTHVKVYINYTPFVFYDEKVKHVRKED